MSKPHRKPLMRAYGRILSLPLRSHATNQTRANVKKQCQENPRANNHCNPPSVEKGAETLVLVVTVSGAPYQEDAEERRARALCRAGGP